MLDSKDERIQLDAGKYLMDRIYGKAAQSVDMKHSGDEEKPIPFRIEKPIPFRIEIVHVGSRELSATREYKR